jgi:hypothetical protein
MQNGCGHDRPFRYLDVAISPFEARVAMVLRPSVFSPNLAKQDGSDFFDQP